MSNYEIACYHWSGWHMTEEGNRKRGYGWTEWEYLKRAIPRFVGHEQPKIPLWGYFDDTLPENAALQIDAAADHGVTSFLFVWGQNPDPALYHDHNVALDRGFLRAPNRKRLKFALMWCCNGAEDLSHNFDTLVRDYFSQPNYLRLDGKLYLSIYELYKFVPGCGGIDRAAAAVEQLRRKTRAAGLGEIHLAAIEFGVQDWCAGAFDCDVATVLARLGVESLTSYTWAHNVYPRGELFGPYDQWARDAMACWPQFERRYGLPYHPNVSVGWDPSPRCPCTQPYRIGGPLAYHTLTGDYEVLHKSYLSPIVHENTPAAFEKALMDAKAYAEAKQTAMLTLYAWNEWTEGGHLEPDHRHGYGYLEAVRRVFGG